MKIIENFLPIQEFNILKNTMTGTTCTDKEYRIVINFNYFKIKDERNI